MSFESGSLSFRIFHVQQEMPADCVERFAENCAPSLDALKETPIQGWVTGRHLLDRRITEDTAMYAGFLRLALMTAERKIPSSLFKAECRMEELARMQAMNAGFLSQKIRGEIRREVTSRLLPQMPPQLKGITFVHDANSRLIYADALSEAQHDAFQIHFARALKFQPFTLTPDTAAALRRKLDVRNWGPISFSPELPDEDGQHHAGLDFLTWLLFFTEARGGIVNFPSLGEFGVMIEGPLTFVMEGNGAHETVLRKGEPLFAAEAKTALLSGKKLRRAKLIMARGDEQWSVTVDADQFVFRGLKLPDIDEPNPLARFQQRMVHLDTFKEAFFGLYERFIDERENDGRWHATIRDVHKWLAERGSRK